MPPLLNLLQRDFLVTAGVALAALLVRFAIIPLIKTVRHDTHATDTMDRFEAALDRVAQRLGEIVRTELRAVLSEARVDGERRGDWQVKQMENMLTVMLEKLRREIEDDARRSVVGRGRRV